MKALGAVQHKWGQKYVKVKRKAGNHELMMA